MSLSEKSMTNLNDVAPVLKKLALAVSDRTSITVTCGYRDPKEQMRLFMIGRELKGEGPNAVWVVTDQKKIVTKCDGTKIKSKHNKKPAEAIDMAPNGRNGKPLWAETKAFVSLSKIVLEEAKKLGIKIRWGGDFNGNEKADDKFVDIPHYELL